MPNVTEQAIKQLKKATGKTRIEAALNVVYGWSFKVSDQAQEIEQLKSLLAAERDATEKQRIARENAVNDLYAERLKVHNCERVIGRLVLKAAEQGVEL